jgi:hypothetical protein
MQKLLFFGKFDLSRSNAAEIILDIKDFELSKFELSNKFYMDLVYPNATAIKISLTY